MLWARKVYGLPKDLGILECTLIKSNNDSNIETINIQKCLLQMKLRNVVNLQKKKKCL